MPASDVSYGDIQNSILGGGSMVISAKVVNSILSANVRVHENAQLDSSIIFDGVEIGAGVRNCDAVLLIKIFIYRRVWK